MSIIAGRMPRLLMPARFSLSWIVLCALLTVLCVAGGASRADAMGQVIVRSASALALLVVALFGERPSFRGVRPVLALLLAALALVLLQLVPLPPVVWTRLPGRTIFVAADALAGNELSWRPLAIAPGFAINAAASLLVPAAVLVLLCGLSVEERSRLSGLLIGLIAASALLGVFQFSGAGFGSTPVDNAGDEATGFFANRNHFALLLAQGCLLVPVWTFAARRRARWRMPAGAGLLLVFFLVILASGSRAGMMLGGLALVIGAMLGFRGLREKFGTAPRWVAPAVVAGFVGVIAVVVLASVVAGRAVSVDRAITLYDATDIRRRGLPVVLDMIAAYFPAGSGFGGFDAVFRLHEPFDLLKPTYFNHAHDDLLEVVLDGGLPGLLLLAAALCWWAWTSVRAWRAGAGTSHALPKLGSAILLLTLVASIVDYPARTPMIMAMIMIAATWLSAGSNNRGAAALPHQDQHL